MSSSFAKKNSCSETPRSLWGIHGALFTLFIFFLSPSPANAAVNIPITVNLSETVNVTGTPRIAVDVGGTTRYATYSSGTGTNALTFTLAPQAGDVDLDGVTVSSPIDLNGGTIKDAKGNNAALTFTPPSTANVKVNYPSLGMDFVYDADGRYTLNGTAYNDLSSFLTAAGGSFTRASIGTYFDSTGTLQTAASGVPRFDYDPVTHAAKGILIEESRTNKYVYSSNFSDSHWSKARSNVAVNAGIAPDSTNTAQYLYNNGVSGGAYIYQTASYTSDQFYTLSIYAKADAVDKIRLRPATTTGWTTSGSVIFNLVHGTMTYTAPLTGYGMDHIGNGWYRCYISMQFGSVSQTSTYPVIELYSNPLDGTSGVYLWGAQLEQGSFPTSYIPTTTSTVTRAADALSIPLSAWFNATNSSIFSTTTSSGMSVNSWPGISDFNQSGTERFGTYYNSLGSGLVSQQRSGGINPAAGKNGSYSGIPVKMAASFGGEGSHLSVNGSSPLASASGGFPSSLTTMRIGRFDDYLNGNLSSIKYYPTRVTDTQLQLLTQ